MQHKDQNVQENLDELRKEILKDLEQDDNLKGTIANLALSIISIESVIQGSTAVLQSLVDILESKKIISQQELRDLSSKALQEIQEKMDGMSDAFQKEKNNTSTD